MGLFVRPKGIAVDKDKRIWVVDAATNVGKIYTSEPRFLLWFGREGGGPSAMDMPSTIVIDYDHVDMFQEYAVEGAKLEFLVFVANQFTASKIAIYGFGEFPEVTQTPPDKNTQ